MNRVPTNFYRVTARATADGEKNTKGVPTIKTGDLLEIYKNDFGLLAYNLNTHNYIYISKDYFRHSLTILEVAE